MTMYVENKWSEDHVTAAIEPTVVSKPAMSMIERGLQSMVEEAETGDNAVADLESIKEAADFLSVTVTMPAGGEGDGDFVIAGVEVKAAG